MLKFITIFCLMTAPLSVFAKGNSDHPKKLYTYQALVALYFPNEAFNSVSLYEQCEKLGGKLISTANRNEAYSVNAYAGVCKIPVDVEQ